MIAIFDGLAKVILSHRSCHMTVLPMDVQLVLRWLESSSFLRQ